MDDISDPVRHLGESECWELLRSETFGRVVTRVGDVLDIFPINYVADEGSILVRTAEGTKLTEMVIGREVLFEVDRRSDHDAWSVVVRGEARRLETAAEIEEAERAGLQPEIPTLKLNFVRIAAASVTGRAFAFGPEPERGGVQPY